ncbi:energy transducer TonB, partial [Erythrobacter sp. SN021]|nr:energy transducer TonB [Erythrobacter sp. SN021]
MERTGIRAEERTGLIVAVVLHLALFGLLVVQGLFPAPVIDPPQRMTVSLAEDVGLAATAPDPVAESRASTAPTMDLSPA